MEVSKKVFEVYCTGTCGGRVGHFGVAGYKVITEGQVIREEIKAFRGTMSEAAVPLMAFAEVYEWIRDTFPTATLKVRLPKPSLPLVRGILQRAFEMRPEWRERAKDDAFEEGTDPELERKVRERWEEESSRISEGPRRPAVYDMTPRLDRVKRLTKGALDFLEENTPRPEEGLAVATVIEMILRRDYRLTRDSRKALQRLADDMAREECGEIPPGPKRPAVFDVTQRMEQVRWLTKWTLGFLIGSTPHPEEGLAVATVIAEILRKGCRLTRESREALRELAEEVGREMRGGGVILEGEQPKLPQRYPASSGTPQASEEPNYYY